MLDNDSSNEKQSQDNITTTDITASSVHYSNALDKLNLFGSYMGQLFEILLILGADSFDVSVSHPYQAFGHFVSYT